MLPGPIKAILVFLFLAVTAILGNAIQICSLVVLPFSRGIFRRINRAIAGVYWKQCVLLVTWFYGVEIVYTGDQTPPGERVILFCNHQGFPDILALMPLADRNGRLPDMKWFAKDSLKYLPGVGWGMQFIDCIFLKRNWSEDAEKIRATFAKLVKNQLNFWMVSFSEGTRITPAKLKRSQDFAKRQGLPVLENVLIPRTRGFTASVEGLGASTDAVYDVTIAYDPQVVSLWRFLQGDVKKFHLHVRRFPMSSLPKVERELSRWLIERFGEKDRILATFARNRRFS